MITVDKVVNKSKNASGIVNEQIEELLKTGEIKATRQSYMPYIALAVFALLTAAYLWWKGKQTDATISGKYV